MHGLPKYIFSVLLVLIACSCVTSRKVNYWQEPDKRIPAYNDSIAYEDYHIRKGDRLYIYVYSLDPSISKLFNSGTGGNMRQYSRMQENSLYGGFELYSYLVDGKGNIQFPTIGDVPVYQLTTREVKRELEKQLATLVTPVGDHQLLTVEVQVVQRSFSIIGPTRSGRFSLTKEKMTIFEALAMAGDLGDLADRGQLMLIRETEDSTMVKTFDVRSKDIVNSEFYYIEPNDVIYIRYMKGYSFGMSHVTSTISVVASTLSFGVFIYSFLDRYVIQPSIQASHAGNGSPEEGGDQ